MNTDASPCEHQPLTLYQINTRLWLRELGVARLRDVPDAALDDLRARGFDVVWLMGVWTPSATSAKLAARPELFANYRIDLPDVTPEDIDASPYAIAGYELSPRLGPPEDLDHLRARLHQRGLRLILDFVPNHTALDHPFTTQRPELYAAPPPHGPAPHPEDVFTPPGGVRVLFHGRDPHFPPWNDTAQVDYRRADTHVAMTEELLRVAARCDGVRCDMAMLMLSDVFARTWDGRSPPPPPALAARGEFWSRAIDAVRARHPGFLFIAEAYWGLERRLQALGFDFTYDKALYDLVLHGNAGSVYGHLAQGRGRQRRALRFLENHDETRAAAHPRDRHLCAALIALTLPGLRLLHHGQLEGARRRVPVQLLRRAVEPVDDGLARFYAGLLRALQDPVLRRGDWRLLPAQPTWPGNPSHTDYVLYGWDGSHLGLPMADGGHRLLAVNLAPHPSQCHVRLPLPGLAGREVQVEEVFGTGNTPAGEAQTADGRPTWRRAGDALAEHGLFLDLPPFCGQLLRLRPVAG